MPKLLIFKNPDKTFVKCKDSVKTYVNIRLNKSTSSSILGRLLPGDRLPISLNNEILDNGETWYNVKLLSGGISGYVRGDNVDVVTNSSSYSQAQTQALIDSLVAQDKKNYDLLLQLSKTAEELKGKGYAVGSQQKELSDIALRLSERQSALKNESWFGSVKSTLSSYWESAKSAFEKLLASVSGIGAIPVIPVIIAAVAVLSAGVGVGYICFAPKYEQSKVDWDKLNSLKKVFDEMAKTNPKAVDDAKKEIQDLTDDAYNKGKNEGTWDGVWSIVKPIALMGAGFWLVTKFIDTQKKRR